MSVARPFDIPKELVTAAFRAVKSNAGGAGIDKETIGQFESKLASIIHRAWPWTPQACAIGRVDGGFLGALFNALRIGDRGSSGACRKAHGLRAVIVPARSASTGACG